MPATLKLPLLTKKVKMAATLGLAFLAMVANSLNVPLFYGVDFIFGSVAVMFSILFLGTVSALLVALAGGLVTIFLWGHPYALIIFSVEALVVSYLYRRGICNLVMADLVYWLFIGVPMILFFYYNQLNMDWQATSLISLKQPLNGLFNILITGVILILLQLCWPSAKNPGLELGSFRLTNSISHILLTILLLAGGISLVHNGVYYRSFQETALVENFTARTANFTKTLELDSKAKIPLEFKSKMAMAVVAGDGRILTKQGGMISDTAFGNRLNVISNNLSILATSGNESIMQRMKQGRYIVRLPLNGVSTGSYLIIEHPAISLINKLEHRGLILLFWMTLLLIFGIILSLAINRLLPRSTNRLGITSRDLSTQIENCEHVIFPNSKIEDYANLSTARKNVANHLKVSFKNLLQNGVRLEKKIELKTSELKDSLTQFSFALEGEGDGFWDWNLQTNTVDFSLLWVSTLGYQKNELSQNVETFISLIHPDDSQNVQQIMKDIAEDNLETFAVEIRLRCQDGSYKWIANRSIILTRDSQNKISRMVGMHTDITERKRDEEKIQLAATVFSHTREGIIIIDASARIVEINNAFTAITGYSREEVIGQNPRILKSDRESPEFYSAMWQAVNTNGYWIGKILNRRKNGQPYSENLTLSVVKNAYGKVSHYVALFSDITQLNSAHRNEIEQVAHYDNLTNLPNRTLLADRLNQAILKSHYDHSLLAVAILDLDDFKTVNDNHGDHVGDELLFIISLRIKEVLREGDTLARIGGDEFVLVLSDLVKTENCSEALEKILLAVSKPVTVGDLVLTVSASIGVAFCLQGDANEGTLMRHADQAMYLAKQAGKNCYHIFDSSHDNAVSVRQLGLTHLREALDRREFVLYYQPKVNMYTGEVKGVEALIRWQHPVRGLVPPLDFLPMIENHAISLDIGEWVIDTALSQISQWQKIGIKMPISVNISAYQLQQVNFGERLAESLTVHSDVSPHLLELEVLETSAFSDINYIIATMEACIERGVSFALDDFGTGYSSLTYLRRLPANLIKIDQSFIRDMLTDEDDLAIVRGVISLAKAFQLEVIAEGVETIEHGAALLELGCHLAQGYGIARPMPAGDVTTWLDNWNPDTAWVT
jgi:diguanylate cyclase (GGDEF)-like protein/PAS domain S-box-containing protein